MPAKPDRLSAALEGVMCDVPECGHIAELHDYTGKEAYTHWCVFHAELWLSWYLDDDTREEVGLIRLTNQHTGKPQKNPAPTKMAKIAKKEIQDGNNYTRSV